ncbi:hypothetical protein CH276_22745 [Rhodococcus sp. 06-470-2]|uniref:hypothetical protein n=1 Tax=unclassified Rhodococcus (in: high G+C Gram-positive bacteria) TaxID=192944 RepID=UPI000B9B51DD|nr:MULTISPECIES: hypothetical protein [unclassified Rhodococcus (in: high G+C Gram-positive bacteria)]OZC59268.1 hypothetical protein CH276_22745 [Rhodococcus sp. 06-470-2]OZE63628.1 hypothetical protein CH265_12185 [Rhodococcus sp. 05-2221-1B]
MPVAPALYVQTPTLTPARFGLSSAAEQIVESDLHFRNGVEFIENPHGVASLTAAECATGPSTARVVDDGMPLVEAEPIIVYNGFTCRAVGVSETEMLDRARQALASGEWQAVEKAIWDTATLRLMEDGVTDELNTTAVPLVQGIGILEAHLYENYGGVGVIHAPRHVAASAAERRQVDTETGRKVTTLGTRWSFGHYPNTGPDGTEAASGTAWLVGTGAVYTRRSEASSRPTNLAGALNRNTNEIFAIAERTYVAAWETVPAAVLVTL